MSCRFRHRFLWLLLALVSPGLVIAGDQNNGDQNSREVRRPDTLVEGPPKMHPRDNWPLLAPLALPGMTALAAEPVLIRFEESKNRFVGAVNMERFLRPGLDAWLAQTTTQGGQGFVSAASAFSRSFDSADAAVFGPKERLHKNAVLKWSPSDLLRVSLDVVAASGLQVVAPPGAFSSDVGGPALDGIGKKPGGQSFSYAAQASSIGTAGLSYKPAVSAFSLQGYQLGLQSSLGLGENAYLGFDLGLGQALSRDINSEAAQQLMITSLGVGLGGKRFRARINSDLFTSGQSLYANQQSSVGVQFDWQFDDSTLSVGARRPLSGGASAMEQDFSTTIPYIRYRKEL